MKPEIRLRSLSTKASYGDRDATRPEGVAVHVRDVAGLLKRKHWGFVDEASERAYAAALVATETPKTEATPTPTPTLGSQEED